MSMDGRFDFDVIGQFAPEEKPKTDNKVAEEAEEYDQAAGLEPESERRKAILQTQQESLLRDREAQLRDREAQLEADKLQERQTIRKLRVSIAGSIFILIFLWLIGVIWLVFLGSYEVQYFQGSCSSLNQDSFYEKLKVIPQDCQLILFGPEKTTTYLKLPESIMTALITTTTINVIGLAIIVAKWLFPTENQD